MLVNCCRPIPPNCATRPSTLWSILRFSARVGGVGWHQSLMVSSSSLVSILIISKVMGWYGHISDSVQIVLTSFLRWQHNRLSVQQWVQLLHIGLHMLSAECNPPFPDQARSTGLYIIVTFCSVNTKTTPQYEAMNDTALWDDWW